MIHVRQCYNHDSFFTGSASHCSLGGSKGECMHYACGLYSYFWFSAKWILYLFIFQSSTLNRW